MGPAATSAVTRFQFTFGTVLRDYTRSVFTDTRSDTAFAKREESGSGIQVFDSKLSTRSLRDGTKQRRRIRRTCRASGANERVSLAATVSRVRVRLRSSVFRHDSSVALIYAFYRPMYNQHRQLDRHPSLSSKSTNPRPAREGPVKRASLPV